MVTIERYEWASDLAVADLERVNAVHNAVWAEWIAGDRPMDPAAYVDAARFSAHPERFERVLARDDDGLVVGFGELFWREGPGAAILRVFVDPARRAGGVGAALGAALVGAATAAGRSGVTLEVAVGSPAEAICRARGLQPDLVMEQNRTDPRSVPVDLLEGWRRAGEAAAGYSLVAFDVPCPSEALGQDFVDARMVMNDAPRWEGEPEATYTVEELFAVEAASAAAHQDWWNVGVRHDASGALVGLSELYLPQKRPWIAIQGDTGVAAAHRGHGLGAWMKAVNHLRLNAERPDVEIVQTWNASANEPMLRINRALGFEPVQRYQGWFLPLP